MTLYLSRIRLSHSSSAQALAPLLVPADAGLRRAAAHNLLWSVFTDGPDRTRDFLWREDREGDFLTLSHRPPVQSDLFFPHEVKPFEPALATGERVAFRLRANATRMKRNGPRVDVVMDALHAKPKESRAEHRIDIARVAGTDWLSRQGVKAGFKVLQTEVEDYSVEVLPGYRGPRKGQPQFGIIDLFGRLEITNPATFLTEIGKGFGRAKAFGCGLMLIRRTP